MVLNLKTRANKWQIWYFWLTCRGKNYFDFEDGVKFKKRTKTTRKDIMIWKIVGYSPNLFTAIGISSSLWCSFCLHDVCLIFQFFFWLSKWYILFGICCVILRCSCLFEVFLVLLCQTCSEFQLERREALDNHFFLICQCKYLQKSPILSWLPSLMVLGSEKAVFLKHQLDAVLVKMWEQASSSNIIQILGLPCITLVRVKSLDPYPKVWCVLKKSNHWYMFDIHFVVL